MKELIIALNASKDSRIDLQRFTVGFNKFMNENKDKNLELSLYIFNSGVRSVFEKVKIKDHPSVGVISAAGECKFYDSIGTILERTSDRINNLKGNKRPEKVVMAIISENYLDTSNDYSKDEVNTFITYQKEDYGWDFVFLGMAVKNNVYELGISEDSFISTDYTEDGINKIFKVIESRV